MVFDLGDERMAAEAAEKRIRSLGLNPRLVELNKS